MKKVLGITLVIAMLLMMFGCTPAEVSSTSTTSDTETSVQVERPGFGTLTDEDIKIGVSLMDMKNPFMIAVKEGVEAYCEAHNYPVQITAAESSPEKQVSTIETLVSSGVNVLDARIVDTSAVKDILAEVGKKGVAINTFPYMDESDTVVGYDDYYQGEMLAKAAADWINENYNGKCEVALLTQPTIDSVNQRSKAFREYLETNCPGVTIVAEVEGYQPDNGLVAAENVFQKNPDVKAFLCVGDAGAMGAYEAVKQHDPNNLDGYWVGGIDGSDDALALVQEGGPFRCTIAGKYKIQEASWMLMDNLVAAAKGEPYIHIVPQEVIPVTIDNVEAYISREIDYDALPNVYDAYKDIAE